MEGNGRRNLHRSTRVLDYTAGVWTMVFRPQSGRSAIPWASSPPPPGTSTSGSWRRWAISPWAATATGASAWWDGRRKRRSRCRCWVLSPPVCPFWRWNRWRGMCPLRRDGMTRRSCLRAGQGREYDRSRHSGRGHHHCPRTPVAENGQIVVAIVGDEATVKTFYKEKGHFRLQPENQHHGTHHCHRGGDPRQGDLGGAQLRIAFSVKRPGFRRGVCFVGKGRKLADRAGLELMQLCKMRKIPALEIPRHGEIQEFSKRRHRHYRRRQKRDIIVRYGKTESF